VTKQTSDRLKKVGGYAAFSLASMLLFVYLTFPWDSLRSFIEEQAKARLSTATGMPTELVVGDLQPSWFTGVVAKKVMVVIHDPKAAPDTAPASLLLPEVRFRLHLRPLLKFLAFLYIPGLSPPHYQADFSAKLPSGESGGDLDVGLVNKQQFMKIDVTLKGIDLAKSHDLLAVGGVFMGTSLDALDLAGVFNAKGDFSLKGGDLTTLDGTLTGGLDDAMLKGGKAGDLDLPQVALGKLDLDIIAGSGKLDIRKFVIHGDDVDVTGDGCSLVLNRNFAFSSPHGKLKVHFGPELMKRVPYLSLGLTALKAPDRDGVYTVPLSGTLKSPRFM
jgi:type II secretion system protein N